MTCIYFFMEQNKKLCFTSPTTVSSSSTQAKQWNMFYMTVNVQILNTSQILLEAWRREHDQGGDTQKGEWQVWGLEERRLSGVIREHADGVLRFPTQHAEHRVLLHGTYYIHRQQLTTTSIKLVWQAPGLVLKHSILLTEASMCEPVNKCFTWYSSTTENVYSCLAMTWSQFLQTSGRSNKSLLGTF